MSAKGLRLIVFAVEGLRLALYAVSNCGIRVYDSLCLSQRVTIP
jgi:hypothetical protein